jgi:hypothetical protein
MFGLHGQAENALACLMRASSPVSMKSRGLNESETTLVDKICHKLVLHNILNWHDILTFSDDTVNKMG